MPNVWCYRCSRTGLTFPPDYMARWGSDYGVGLGPVPVSEALVNDYNFAPASGRTAETTMHPVANCKSQVDLVSISEEEFDANRAILMRDDVAGIKRAAVMRSRQLVHSPKMAQLFPEECALAREAEKARPMTKIRLAAA